MHNAFFILASIDTVLARLRRKTVSYKMLTRGRAFCRERCASNIAGFEQRGRRAVCEGTTKR